MVNIDQFWQLKIYFLSENMKQLFQCWSSERKNGNDFGEEGVEMQTAQEQKM